MTVTDAIRKAEKVLPVVGSAENDMDPRWQAIIALGEFVDSNPMEVWSFVERWGNTSDEDLRTAIATCLLEDLLEHHFDEVFPKLEVAVKASSEFADTFSRCWQLGQAEA
ncbi:MAG: hypothetical protein ACXWCK_30105, partial [Burkholderiales bacterium]